MINIPLYTVAERRPKYGESVLHLKCSHYFDSYGYTFGWTHIEYQWEVWEGGEYTGCNICYDYLDPDGTEIELDRGQSIKLIIMTSDGYVVDDDTLYCPEDEYWAVLPEQ